MISFFFFAIYLRDLTLLSITFLLLESWQVTHSTYPFYDCFLVHLVTLWHAHD